MATPQNTHNLTELYVKQFGSDPALVRVESLGVFLLGESEEKPVYYRVEKGTAFVPVQGVVSDRASLWYRTASAERLVPVFHELALRPDVKKVVLEIDSPGGSVVALGQIVDALKILKASKPVSSYVIGLCCSAALYLASLTDDIAASSMAMIGSLGVVTMYHDTSKLYNDVGIKAVPITTGEMKVMGVGGVPITESQINTVREKMQRILTDFKAVVQAGRKMSADRVDLIASKGDYWEAAEALRLGLIDKITPHEVYRKENTMSTDTNTTPEPAKTQQTASAPLQSQVLSLSFNETRNIITARCEGIAEDPNYLLEAIGKMLCGTAIETIQTEWNFAKLKKQNHELQEKLMAKEQAAQQPPANKRPDIYGETIPGGAPLAVKPESQNAYPEVKTIQDFQELVDAEAAKLRGQGIDRSTAQVRAMQKIAERYPEQFNTKIIGSQTDETGKAGSMQGVKFVDAKNNLEYII